MRFVVAVLLACGMLPAAEPVRVLVVTGGHDHEASFYAIFDKQADWRVNINPHPGAFNGDLRRNTDVLVLYDMVKDLEPKKQERLREYVEAGRGVVVLHHAIGDYLTWPFWSEEVVGGRGPDKDWLYKHDLDLTIKPQMEHPVLAGIKEFRINDETYKNLIISPKVKVLLRTDHPTSDGPVAWLGLHPKARVVYIELGHGRLAHENPVYRRLIANAINWAAGK